MPGLTSIRIEAFWRIGFVDPLTALASRQERLYAYRCNVFFGLMAQGTRPSFSDRPGE